MLEVGTDRFENPPRDAGPGVATGDYGPIPGPGLHPRPKPSLVSRAQKLQRGGWALIMLPRYGGLTNATVTSTRVSHR